MIGHTLGHCRIVESIGAGGMGEVYRARDEHLGRDVAIKVLPAGTLADESARRRFRKEAEALSKLNHPSIATVHDFDSQDGVDFLVMEYVEGASLAEKLRSGALTEKEITSLGVQVAEALEEAHDRGIVHRDLKPGNIVVTPKGRAKVLDFGLAKLLLPATDSAATQSLAETRAVAGTMPYMAPEQLQGEAADVRTDLYSAGAVFYEMATGHRPFPETQGPRLIDSILHRQPVLPRALNPRLSAELERILLKCLEKDPESRYQSAKELAVDLRRLAAPTATVFPASAGRPRTPVRRTVALSGSALLALLALLAALNMGGWRNRLLGRASAPRIESLAVLPLENLSRDPEQEYFADGMTEALITDLSKIGALRVISRTSVMHYKGTKKTMPEIARELNVDAVVEGSVQRSRDRVRVTAQLIHAPTDRHLWAENYQRDLRDVLALQSELARAIASEIKVKVTPQEQARLVSTRQVNPEVYQLCLKGRFFWYKRNTEGFRKALEYFNQAIEKDPTYALAYAGLASTYNLMGHELYSVLDPREAYPKAKAAARKALELDETLAEAHAVLADAGLRFDRDWATAETEHKRALELNPGYAVEHIWYSHYLLPAGRTEESLAESLRAVELDPLGLILHTHLGWHYLYTRQYDRATEQLRKTLELDSNFILAHLFLGQAYEEKRMYAQAIAEFQKAISLSGGNPVHLAALGHAYAISGKKAEAEEVLSQLKELSKRRYVPSYEIAVVYAGLRENDQALAWLQKAYEQRDSSWLVDLKVDPRFDHLHSDPRFQGLLRRVGLPP